MVFCGRGKIFGSLNYFFPDTIMLIFYKNGIPFTESMSGIPKPRGHVFTPNSF